MTPKITKLATLFCSVAEGCTPRHLERSPKGEVERLIDRWEAFKASHDFDFGRCRDLRSA
ncbi:MAG: hypothetical protein ABR545_13400 [Cyclonatronaceae bacterium]